MLPIYKKVNMASWETLGEVSANLEHSGEKPDGRPGFVPIPESFNALNSLNPALMNCNYAVPRSIFISEDAKDQKLAKAYCLGCRCMENCLDYALRVQEVEGVAGGTTKRERIRAITGGIRPKSLISRLECNAEITSLAVDLRQSVAKQRQTALRQTF